jgi:hypothetical protein
MLIHRAGSSTGSGRNMATLAIPKMVAQAPMPSTEDSTATAVKPGCLRNVHAGKRKILRQVAHPARDPDRPRFLHLVRQISESAQGLVARVSFRHTRLHKVGDFHRQVSFDLFAKQPRARCLRQGRFRSL